MLTISNYSTSEVAHQARAQRLLVALQQYPQGLDSYAMIKALQSAQGCGLPAGSLTEPLVLYHCNFLLYNALYRLRDRLWQERVGHLDIDVLRTVLRPYQAGDVALVSHDALRALFLDTSHLQTISRADVNDLLQQFWTQFYAAEDKHWALQQLEFTEEPADYSVVKQQYRRLAMRYHPDRGGDPETLATLNTAIEILEKCYATVTM